MDKIKKTDHFYLIDGLGIFFELIRFYHHNSKRMDFQQVLLVDFVCFSNFWKIQNQIKIYKNRPFAVIFDSARKTFRNEIYSDYKANRSEAPDDLAPQFEYIRKSVTAFNLPSVELSNYEADDLIATYVERILKIGQSAIVSSDKDLMQLYKKGVRIFDPMKNKLFQRTILRINLVLMLQK